MGTVANAKKQTATKTLVAVFLCCLVIIFASSLFGNSTLSIADIADAETTAHRLWLELRLPRTISAAMVGALMAGSGALMQGLVRNPLASPGLAGISIGASVGAAMAIVLGTSLALDEYIGTSSQSIAAFGGALAVTALVLSIARQGRRIDGVSLLLAGIAVNAFGAAVLALMSYLSTDIQLRSISYWALGSFVASGWDTALWLIIPLVLLKLHSFRNATALDLLALGELEAQAAGVNVERFKVISLLLIVLAVATATSLVGAIGFVGLVVPHICRMLFGASHRLLLPASLSFGAVFMAIADTLCRSVLAPAELPVGIVTATIGGPFFFYLLIQQRRHA